MSWRTYVTVYLVSMIYVLLEILSWQIAFSNAIYLVDVIEGGEVLMKACKPALESTYITKVIHDCKRDSEVCELFC